MKKRGAMTHIEIVIAFLLFISFATTLVLLVKPYKTDKIVSDSVLYSLHDAFEKQNTIDLITVSVRNNNASLKCISLKFGDIFGNVQGEDYSLTIDSEKNSRTSKVSYDSSLKSVLEINNSDHTLPAFIFGYVYISKEFQLSKYIEGCYLESGVEVQDYTIGSISKTQVLSNYSITHFKESYYADYEGLKQSLGIPKAVDFTISTNSFGDNNYDMTRTIPNGVSVVSREFYHEVIYENSSVENEKFIFKVW